MAKLGKDIIGVSNIQIIKQGLQSNQKVKIVSTWLNYFTFPKTFLDVVQACIEKLTA